MYSLFSSDWVKNFKLCLRFTRRSRSPPKGEPKESLKTVGGDEVAPTFPPHCEYPEMKLNLHPQWFHPSSNNSKLATEPHANTYSKLPWFWSFFEISFIISWQLQNSWVTLGSSLHFIDSSVWVHEVEKWQAEMHTGKCSLSRHDKI